MPFLDSAAAHGGAPAVPPKLDTKFLSVLLKVVIMVILTTIFFVFVGVATALFLIHLSFAGAVHGHRHRRRRYESSSGFSPGDLKKLLQFRISNWVNPHSKIDCPICLDGFKMGEWCRKLGGCGHVFHRKCIDSWLIRVSACPLCRCSVRFDLDDDRIHSVSSRNCEIFYAP